MSTAFDMSRPRTFNLPPLPDTHDPLFAHQSEIQPPMDEFNKRLTRYVYYPGDTVAPERKNELEQYAEGGADLNSVCLIRTNGFLPKGKISPLEIGYHWMAPDNMVDVTKAEVKATALPGIEHTPAALALLGVPLFPGEEVENLTGRWKNDRGLATGHVEIKQLLGVSWESGEVQKLNRLFVPRGRAAKTLRELREDIERGAGMSNDQAVKDIANEMLAACRRFEQWATRHVNQANVLLGKSTDKFSYAYTSIDEILLEQLEIPRQDRAVQNAEASQRKLSDMMSVLAEQAIAANTRPQMTPEDMMALFTANQASIVDAISKALEAKQEKPQGNQNNQNRK